MGSLQCQPINKRRVLHAALLLYNVRKFMREQLLSDYCCRSVLFLCKHHISPHRVGQRIHRSRRLGGRGVGMHPHLTEVVPKTRLHEGAGRWIQWLAGGAKNFVDDWRHLGRFHRIDGFALQLIVLTLRTFAAASVIPTRALALQEPTLG
jgi:hypothetical protein